MPRGVPNNKKAGLTAPIPPAPPQKNNAGQATIAQAPLIIIQPSPNGTSYDCYGLRGTEAINELRLVLLDLIALQSDVPIIRGFASRTDAVIIPVVPAKPGVRTGFSKPKTKPALPRNGPSGDVDRTWEDELEDELTI